MRCGRAKGIPVQRIDALVLDCGGVLIPQDPADLDAIGRPLGYADGELWAVLHGIPGYLIDGAARSLLKQVNGQGMDLSDGHRGSTYRPLCHHHLRIALQGSAFLEPVTPRRIASGLPRTLTAIV